MPAGIVFSCSKKVSFQSFQLNSDHAGLEDSFMRFIYETLKSKKQWLYVVIQTEILQCFLKYLLQKKSHPQVTLSSVQQSDKKRQELYLIP